MRSRAGAITPLGRRSNELVERAIKVKDDYYVFTSAWGTEKEDRRNLLKKDMVGGRDGIRTRNPLLAKQDKIQSKSLLRLRLLVPRRS